MSGSNFTHDQLTEIIVTDRLIISQWGETANNIRIDPPKPKQHPVHGPLPPAVPLKQRRKILKRKLRK